MTITKRSVKGSALSYAEMDENIRDLREDTNLNRVLLNGNTSNTELRVPGLPLQVHYHRIDQANAYTCVASGGNLAGEDYSDFGNSVEVEATRMTITPKVANSIIQIDFSMFGEPNSHQSGFLIGQYHSANTTVTVIRRSGFEGFNNVEAKDLNNTYISDFYDSNDATTPRQSNFMYIDKPGTTNPVTYVLIFKATTAANRIYNLNQTVTTGNEHGVSTMKIQEIAT
jgi:hypothetical protein